MSQSHLREYTLPNLPNEIWAYIAGVFDGESCIRCWKSRITTVGPNYNFAIEIAQSRKNNGLEFLNKIKNWLEIGSIVWKRKGKENPLRGTYQLGIRRRIAIYKILRKIRPYLIVKAKRADEIISFFEDTYTHRYAR